MYLKRNLTRLNFKKFKNFVHFLQKVISSMQYYIIIVLFIRVFRTTRGLLCIKQVYPLKVIRVESTNSMGL